MTVPAILLIVAAVAAVLDWAAVATHRTRIEYVAKPAVLALLVVVAALAHVPSAVRPWLIAALALGLAGDIALMFSRGERPDGWFLGGLGAFLLGHIAFVAAFLESGVGWKYLLAGVLVALGVAGLALPAVLRGAAATGGRELAVVVTIYAVLLAAMTTTAIGTGDVKAAVGGVLFLVSDTLLARERFVGPLAERFAGATSGRPGGAPGERFGGAPGESFAEAPGERSVDAPGERRRPAVGELAVIVTYHAAQALILLGLITHF